MRSAALLALFWPALSAADTHGRLTLAASAGGGYASDLFLGAGLGPDGVAQAQPQARFDLSLSPPVKLAAGADLYYGRYLGSGFTTVDETGGLALRLLGGAVDGELGLAFDHASYSQGAPLDPALVTSPSVAATSALRAAPIVRLRELGVEWRAAGLFAMRSSTDDLGNAVPERDLAALGGLLWPLTGRFALSATYKLQRTQSERVDFTSTSHALFGGGNFRLFSATTLDALVQVQTSAYATAATEQVARATLTLTQPLSGPVELEAAYSFAVSATNDPDRPSASRHLAYLGLRVHGSALSW